jgi:hypothetical protein
MPNNQKYSLIKLTFPIQYSGRWGELCTNVPTGINVRKREKKLFKDDIGSCTEAEFLVSDWGDTMKQRRKCCETAMKKDYETAPIIICES